MKRPRTAQQRCCRIDDQRQAKQIVDGASGLRLVEGAGVELPPDDRDHLDSGEIGDGDGLAAETLTISVAINATVRDDRCEHTGVNDDHALP